MFELIGFIAMNVGLGMATMAALIFIFEAIGEYNIGGVPNGWPKRIVCLAILCALPAPWYLLWVNGPIVIHMRGG